MGEIYNNYELKSYCKNEGLNTEYFVLQCNRRRKRRAKKVHHFGVSIPSH